jgi:hypothetical protein
MMDALYTHWGEPDDLFDTNKCELAYDFQFNDHTNTNPNPTIISLFSLATSVEVTAPAVTELSNQNIYSPAFLAFLRREIMIGIQRRRRLAAGEANYHDAFKRITCNPLSPPGCATVVK